MSANDGVNITHGVNHPFSGYVAIKVTANCPWQVVLNWFCGKVISQEHVLPEPTRLD